MHGVLVQTIVVACSDMMYGLMTRQKSMVQKHDVHEVLPTSYDKGSFVLKFIIMRILPCLKVKISCSNRSVNCALVRKHCLSSGRTYIEDSQ